MAYKPHRLLKNRMDLYEITSSVLEKRWGKSPSYISGRITRKFPFTIDEVFDLCELCEISIEEIPKYFPRKAFV